MVVRHRVLRSLVALPLLGTAQFALSSVAGATPPPAGTAITGSCFFQAQPKGVAIANGSTVALTPGSYLNVRSVYNAKDRGSHDIWQGTFNTSLAGSGVTGPAHQIAASKVISVGAGLSGGTVIDAPFTTAGWADGTTATLTATVASTFTGTDPLATCSITVTVLDPNGDLDGDGLLNSWELYGIDGNGDGRADLTLPGANPLHKDLYVEMDWLDCSNRQCVYPGEPATEDSPTDESAHTLGPLVTAAFAQAPVSNPDGGSGIALHVDVDEALPGTPYVKFLSQKTILDHPYTVTFDDLKLGGPGPCDGGFGTRTERTDLIHCAATLAARKMAYRYAVVANGIADGTPIGISELPGNDFLIQAEHATPASTRDDANTFMHELGHTLGLHHGGGGHPDDPHQGDDSNCKPNYRSGMNYATLGLYYSAQELPPLDENHLTESTGIGFTGAGNTTWGVPSGRDQATRVGPAAGPIDWNGDGDTADTAVQDDVNYFGADAWLCTTKSPGEVLLGHDDWHNLLYNFRDSPDYGDLVHRSNPGIVDPTQTQLDAALAAQVDADSDTVPDVSDNCPAAPNPSQQDSNENGIGDACDTSTPVVPVVSASSSILSGSSVSSGRSVGANGQILAVTGPVTPAGQGVLVSIGLLAVGVVLMFGSSRTAGQRAGSGSPDLGVRPGGRGRCGRGRRFDRRRPSGPSPPTSSSH